MPETYIEIRWPNGKKEHVYSPSSIIRDYFQAGTELLLGDFEVRCIQALDHASERVRERYGYACSSAMAEKQRIVAAIKAIQPAVSDNQTVQILTIQS